MGQGLDQDQGQGQDEPATNTLVYCTKSGDAQRWVMLRPDS